MALCTWIGLLIIFIGSIGNWFCIGVFFSKRFRSSVLTPFFVALLLADCIYLTFRLIKLFYYQETLFRQSLFPSSCSSSWILQIYAFFTQYAPQILIPFCQYELYIRFSLLLMSFLAIQRAYDMCQSSSRLITRRSSPRSFSFILIFFAFLLAYLLEFFGLSVFCSSQLSSEQAYQWHSYLNGYLSNETSSFIDFMKNQSATEREIECVSHPRNVCSQAKIAEIVRYYYDQHQRPIVRLIHRIELATVGKRTARNELRLKYHYHTCLFPLSPNRFLKVYDLLYSRFFGFNRYTIILVIGSIVPSILTICSNAVSLRWILIIRRSIGEQSVAMRRRTDETHRVIFIITIECFLAVLNSWLVDLILSLKYCAGSVAIGDDCPQFLRRFHQYLVVIDLFNSMSNIFLYGFAGKRFRSALKEFFRSVFHPMKKPFQIHRTRRQRATEQDELFILLELTPQQQKQRSGIHVQKFYENFKMKPMKKTPLTDSN